MTKYELKEYRDIVEYIKQIEEQIARLKSQIESPKTQILSDMPKSQAAEDIMAKTVEKMLELQDEYFVKLKAMVSKQLEIEQAIADLPAREQRLMRLKYIEGLTWEEVAVKMHYGYQWVCTLHGRILQTLNKR